MNAPLKPVRLFSRTALLVTTFLFAVNAFVCQSLFAVEYTSHWASIEGAYIGISRYILHAWPRFTWFPLWYDGIPFQNSYPPLLHMLVAACAWFSGVSPARAHHIVTGGLYCLGPAALFLLLYALSAHLGLSLTAALIFSFTSSSALFLHGASGSMESVRVARRLETLISYGDGPHVSSITLLLFAILGLHLAIDRGGAIWAWVAILTFGSVVLTNWLGTFALALASFAYLLARSSWDRRRLRTLRIAAGIGGIAFCLVVTWIPPSSLSAIQRNAQFVIGEYPVGVRQFGCWGGYF